MRLYLMKRTSKELNRLRRNGKMPEELEDLALAFEEDREEESCVVAELKKELNEFKEEMSDFKGDMTDFKHTTELNFAELNSKNDTIITQNEKLLGYFLNKKSVFEHLKNPYVAILTGIFLLGCFSILGVKLAEWVGIVSFGANLK